MVNPLDWVVGYFSPKAGLEREVARQRLEYLRALRSYEGASRGRLAKGWPLTPGTADTHLTRHGQVLRDRSRDLVRNHPFAAKIVTTHANNLVGPGVVPRAKTGNPDMDKLVDDLFASWSEVCNSNGGQDFYGSTYTLARMMVTTGEAFVRRRRRRLSDGLPVPLQIEVLASEFCDWWKSGRVGDNVVLSGLEYDQLGKIRGYWLHPVNPRSTDATMLADNNPRFVPAEDVAHFFERQDERRRGEPWLAPVIAELREVKDYELAESIRKKTEACLVGVVIPTSPETPNVGFIETKGDGGGGETGGGPPLVDANGNPVNRMEPGMFAVMPDGGDIKFNTPAISAGIEAYLRTRYRSISAGARVPYSLMTGDFSQDNFASGQLGLIDYYLFIDAITWHSLISPVLQRIWNWFVEAAKIAGKIPASLEVGVEWTPPERERLNRLDNARADLIEVRMGKRSPQEIIAKTGRDPIAVLKEIDEFLQEVDKTKSKVVLDSDPRKVSLNGQAQLFGADTGGNEGGEQK